ncbi:hypothetical protein M3Y98_00848000 [Aphelenchoides besseyi]|nr:hypothetical protein M3Y98_00848000 [Aphelenchoides besseyi]
MKIFRANLWNQNKIKDCALDLADKIVVIRATLQPYYKNVIPAVLAPEDRVNTAKFPGLKTLQLRVQWTANLEQFFIDEMFVLFDLARKYMRWEYEMENESDFDHEHLSKLIVIFSQFQSKFADCHPTVLDVKDKISVPAHLYEQYRVSNYWDVYKKGTKSSEVYDTEDDEETTKENDKSGSASNSKSKASTSASSKSKASASGSATNTRPVLKQLTLNEFFKRPMNDESKGVSDESVAKKAKTGNHGIDTITID